MCTRRDWNSSLGARVLWWVGGIVQIDGDCAGAGAGVVNGISGSRTAPTLPFHPSQGLLHRLNFNSRR